MLFLMWNAQFSVWNNGFRFKTCGFYHSGNGMHSQKLHFKLKTYSLSLKLKDGWKNRFHLNWNRLVQTPKVSKLRCLAHTKSVHMHLRTNSFTHKIIYSRLQHTFKPPKASRVQRGARIRCKVLGQPIPSFWWIGKLWFIDKIRFFYNLYSNMSFFLIGTQFLF